MDTRLERLYLLEIVLDLLLLLRESDCCHLGILHLVLLELEITSHIIDLRHRWQLILPCHGLLHVLKQACNKRLTVLDFLLALCLLVVELERELVDFLFLLVEDLVLLLFAMTTGLTIFFKVIVDFLDVLLVLVNHFSHLKQVFIHLLQLSVVLLDPVLEALSSFRQRQVHLVCLKFKVLLSLHELSSLILEMLSSLL